MLTSVLNLHVVVREEQLARERVVLIHVAHGQDQHEIPFPVT